MFRLQPGCLGVGALRSCSLSRRARGSLFSACTLSRLLEGAKPIDVFIDRDGCGLDVVKNALSALRKEGELANTTVFGAPWQSSTPQAKKWNSFYKENRIREVQVPRKMSSARDPNDAAITQEALKWASTTSNRRLALLIDDVDFLLLVTQLQDIGKAPIVVLPTASKSVLLQQFKRTGAHVLVALPDHTPVRRVRAVLLPDGNGRIDVLGGAEHLEKYLVDLNVLESLAESLEGLGYHTRSVPFNATSFLSAIAKFWHVNQLGPLAVYPHDLAHNSISEMMLHNPARTWCPKIDELTFVLPMGNPKKSKKSLSTYGTAGAGAIANGGGPFMLTESADLVERFLRRLGYIDGRFNTDMNEALFVFSQATKNSSNLRKLGISDLSECSPIQAMAILKGALQSNDHGGTWQVPPQDGSVRELLVSKGLLGGIHAPRAEVHDALKIFSRSSGLRTMKTYHAYVWQIYDHLNKDNPCRRK